MTTPSTPADWYPDPEDPNGLRYWDGTTWTEHRAPAVTPAAPAEAPPADVPPAAADPLPDTSAELPSHETPSAATAYTTASVPSYRPLQPHEQPAADAATTGPPTESSAGPNKKLFGILGGVAALVLVVALVLVYFFVFKDDGTKTASASSSSSSSSSSKTSTSKKTTTSETAAPVGGQTIDEYAAANGITEKASVPSQDGAPAVNLPTPDGWEIVDTNLPEYSYASIFYGSAADASRPRVFAYLTKLTGDVDVNTIIGLAPNELLALDDYEPVAEGTPSDLGGFQAYALAGTYLLNGTPTFVAQKTALIPTGDGVYVLRLYGYSTPEQQSILGTALDAIDAGTTIG